MLSINAYVGKRIRSFRKARGFTQADLGELVDLPQPYVGGIERGERNISLETMHKLLNALNITPADLFREYDDGQRSELNDIIERINAVLSTRTPAEVQIIENLITDVLTTIDQLKKGL